LIQLDAAIANDALTAWQHRTVYFKLTHSSFANTLLSMAALKMSIKTIIEQLVMN